MKRFLFALFALILIPAGILSAQGKSSLTIECNQSQAKVYIDDQYYGVTTPTYSTLLAPGRYEIRVVKEGYPEFRTTITMANSAMIVNARLGPGPVGPTTVPPPPPPPPQNRITVTANVPGAQVYINNVFAGPAPFSTSVSPGSYAVSVRAEGYNEFRQNVVVNGSVTVNAILTAQGFDVAIDTPGVRGADIYRNGGFVGRTPYRDTWAPGAYSIVIKAEGYNEYRQNITVNGPLNLQIPLVGQGFDVSIDTPGVRGADIYRNGGFVGRTPYRDRWAPGTYSIVIKAEGYNEYRQNLSVNGTVNLQAALVAQGYDVSIDTPGVRNADIYRNGGFVGRTPYRDSWSPGTYSIVIKAEGYNEYRQNLTVNGPVNLQAPLVALGYDVAIDTPGVRNADIYRNGSFVGRTPYRDRWTPGTYSIVIKLEGYNEYRQNLTVNGPINLQAPLVPLAYDVAIDTPGVRTADIYRNGSFVGRPPYRDRWAPGTYSLVIKADGYNEYRQNLTVNGPINLQASLVPLVYDVAIDTPGLKNADIYRNGSFVGRSPYRDTWAPGTYSIVIKAEGYNEYRQNLSVSAPVNLQAAMVPLTYDVSIDSPGIKGAEIYRNGGFVGRTPYRDAWTPGTYSILIKFEGYNEYRQNLTVNGPANIQAVMVPLGYDVSVDSPGVKGADIYRNGSFLGRTPYRDTWSPGTYSLVLKAEGYNEYRQNLTVNGPVNLQAAMVPLAVEVLIDSPGLKGADIYRNGSFVGRTPYRDTWTPGTYSIVVKAEGYTEYRQNITASGPVNIQAVLTPLAVNFEIRLPDAFIEREPGRDSRDSGRNPKWRQFTMYIDKVQIYSLYGTINPGKHSFVMDIGGIVFESEFTVQQGKNCIIQPEFTVRVIQ